MIELPNPLGDKPIVIDKDDVVLVIHKNGNIEMTYELSDPEGKPPVSMTFINGLAIKLQDPKMIEEIIKLGVLEIEGTVIPNVEQ